MTKFNRILAALALATLVAFAGGCGDDDEDNGGSTNVDLNREYVQIERLGNPLVSEVFLAKRNHGAHNATGPAQDAQLYKTEMEAFVAAFGRPALVGTTLTSVLLPDMLIVDSSKSSTSAGWLSWALANGYGGRKLADDVVDAGLSAIFGTLISPTGAIPSLASDNVDANDKSFGTSFPYLATPHTN
jgi:hypothetical protein